MKVSKCPLRFLLLLQVLLISSSRGQDEQNLDNLTEYSEESTEFPSNFHYKEFLNNLKCDELNIRYFDDNMIKVDEVESGTIYKFQPAPIDNEDGSAISEGRMSRTEGKTSRWWSPALGLVVNDARLMHSRDDSILGPVDKNSTSGEHRSHSEEEPGAHQVTPSHLPPFIGGISQLERGRDADQGRSAHPLPSDPSFSRRRSHRVGGSDAMEEAPAHPLPTDKKTSRRRRSYPGEEPDAIQGTPVHPPPSYNGRSHSQRGVGASQGILAHPLPRDSSFGSRRPHPVGRLHSNQGMPAHPPSRSDFTFSSGTDEAKNIEDQEKESEHYDPSYEHAGIGSKGGRSSMVDGYESDHSSSNKDCGAPLSTGWLNYNWYQILLDNGGPPGGYLKGTLTGELTEVAEPCSRPLLAFPPLKHGGELIYTFYGLPSNVFRREKLNVRFAGTSKEFLDIEGNLLWSPPNATRHYHLKYRKDDSGLYAGLLVDRICNIVQKLDPFTIEGKSDVECKLYLFRECDCDDHGREVCRPGPYFPPPSAVTSAPLPKLLQCSLVGGYGKCE